MLQEGPSPVSGIAPGGDGRAVLGRRSFQSYFQYIELASIGHGGEAGVLQQLAEGEFQIVHFFVLKKPRIRSSSRFWNDLEVSEPTIGTVSHPQSHLSFEPVVQKLDC